MLGDGGVQTLKPPLCFPSPLVSPATSPPTMAQLDCVLLPVNAHLGQLRNDTTASTTTSNHDKIEVSLCPAQPPLPSKLYVHCPDLTLTDPPRLISAAEDLLLLRVGSSINNSDYFVYRAGNQRQASLQRLLRPHPFFQDNDVGLLSRGANYTVAALVETGTPVYDLHIFHSENPLEWIYRKVSVTEPQRSYPMLIPDICGRLLYHDTSTVISIGGEAGTMGWVDLWRGILLCDVLSDDPTLRGVPLPVPVYQVTCDNGLGDELGSPIPFRGIAFVKGGGDNPEDCIKLVHLDVEAALVPDSYDVQTESPSCQMHNWTIVTYTKTSITNSWKDWRMDFWVQASDVAIDTKIKSELLQSGLLGSASVPALQNLFVGYPATDISAADHEGIVYLMARKNYQDPKGWMLALDLRKKTLVGATESDIEWPLFASAMHRTSSIAKHNKPSTGC